MVVKGKRAINNDKKKRRTEKKEKGSRERIEGGKWRRFRNIKVTGTSESLGSKWLVSIVYVYVYVYVCECMCMYVRSRLSRTYFRV